MTTAAEEVPNRRRDRPEQAIERPRWWRELLIVGSFYLVYTWIRNQFGSAAVDADVAFANAEYMIDFERALGLYFEPELQRWFLEWDWFLRGWNIFYGTLHFVITVGVLVYLYLKRPVEYPRQRTTGLATTGIALAGFAIFPLMPPRLLGNCRVVGACVDSPYVDTMAEIGGIWSFDSGTMEAISNQYAAMPSLHFAWALWSLFALLPHLTRPSARLFMLAYPWLTLFAIVVTANHYWIDAAGGGVVFLAGWAIGRRLHPTELTLTGSTPQ